MKPSWDFLQQHDYKVRTPALEQCLPVLRRVLIHRRRTVLLVWNVAALRWAAIQVCALLHGNDHVVMSCPVFYSSRARQGLLLSSSQARRPGLQPYYCKY